MSGSEHRFGTACLPHDFRLFPQWCREVEAMGFDSLGTGDSSTLWTDPFVTMAVAAMSTERVRLSVGGTNPITRHPVVAAAAIESVQLLSGGRCSYTLGSGDSAVANIGVPRARLAQVEEYGRAVQALTAGRTATYQGRELRINWAADPVPVALCAEGPKTQELVGRFADGAMLFNGLTEDVVSATLANVARGARETGRSVEDLDLWWPVAFNLCDDRDAGIEELKFSLAGTANRAFRYSLYDKLVPEHLHAGFRGLQEEYGSQHHQQLQGHARNASLLDKYGLTDYLVERFSIIGPPSYCVERLEEVFSYGVRNVSLTLLARDLPEQLQGMRVMADEILPAFK